MIKLNIFSAIILISLLFYSCDNRGQKDVIRPHTHLMPEVNPDLNQRLGWKSVSGPWYQDGERFTGTQTYYHQDEREDPTPLLVRTIEDGLVLQELAFHKNGEQFGHTEYEYRGDTLVRVMEFFLNGNKKNEMIHPSMTDDSLGLAQEWHENGELKFHTRFDEHHQYVGLITLWDEDGAIVEQETN